MQQNVSARPGPGELIALSESLKLVLRGPLRGGNMVGREGEGEERRERKEMGSEGGEREKREVGLRPALIFTNFGNLTDIESNFGMKCDF